MFLVEFQSEDVTRLVPYPTAFKTYYILGYRVISKGKTFPENKESKSISTENCTKHEPQYPWP